MLQIINNIHQMTHNTTRTKSGTCVCNWEECAKWTKIFKASTTTHKKLGSLARFKFESRKGSDSNDSEYNNKKLMFEKYMKGLCVHLKIDYKCVSDKTQVWVVAKHHFPWTPILEDKMRFFRNPISQKNARKYKIGVIPDHRNIATKTRNGYKYSFVPNVAKNAVKKLAEETGLPPYCSSCISQSIQYQQGLLISLFVFSFLALFRVLDGGGS